MNNIKELPSRICEVYGGRDGIVTIISDDAGWMTCSLLDTWCEELGLKITVAGPVYVILFRPLFWVELMGKGHLEMVNHSYSHIRLNEDGLLSENSDILNHEISEAQEYISETFGSKLKTFVCPFNIFCDVGYKYLEENGYYAARRSASILNSLSPNEGHGPGEWLNLGAMGITNSGVTGKERNGWVDTAAKEHKWLIEMWHLVGDEKDSRNTIPTVEAKEHLEYVSYMSDSKSVWNAYFTDAVKYIRERQSSTPVVYLEDGKINVKVFMNRKLDRNIFNHPLTVEYEHEGVKHMVDVYPEYEEKNE